MLNKLNYSCIRYSVLGYYHGPYGLKACATELVVSFNASLTFSDVNIILLYLLCWAINLLLFRYIFNYVAVCWCIWRADVWEKDEKPAKQAADSQSPCVKAEHTGCFSIQCTTVWGKGTRGLPLECIRTLERHGETWILFLSSIIHKEGLIL